MYNLDEVIKILKLEPLEIEGGLFHRTFISRKTVTVSGNKGTYERSALSGIYYLVTESNFSTLHRVKHDEVFHFYFGDSVNIVQFTDETDVKEYGLGHDLEAGDRPQILVPAGTWQGLRVKPGGKWALMGVNVAPGFEDEDVEIPGRTHLLNKYPKLPKLIEKYTRP